MNELFNSRNTRGDGRLLRDLAERTIDIQAGRANFKTNSVKQPKQDHAKETTQPWLKLKVITLDDGRRVTVVEQVKHQNATEQHTPAQNASPR